LGLVEFSQQCCEFWLRHMRVMALAHAPEIRGRESADTGAASTDERGKVTDGMLAPTRGGNLAADEFADAPVEVNQLEVDGVAGPGARRGPGTKTSPSLVAGSPRPGIDGINARCGWERMGERQWVNSGGGALLRAAGTQVSDPVCRSGWSLAGSEAGAPSRRQGRMQNVECRKAVPS
jgi:hypothetical protein